MRKLLIVFLIGLLFANCDEKKIESNKELEDFIKIVEDTAKKIDEVEKSTLNIIDGYQEITLGQKGDQCGEWGGNREEIRIYKADYKGDVIADYTKNIVDCERLHIENYKPVIIIRKAIPLSKSQLNLTQESIFELIDYKLTTKMQFGHSGIRNYIISRDSTLVIDHCPSNKWSKFRKLINQIEK